MEQEINFAMNIFNGLSYVSQLREESPFQRFSSGTGINHRRQQETYVARRPLGVSSVLDTNCGFLIVI
jgi:hypothetical protein